MEDNNGRVTMAVMKQTIMDLSTQIAHLAEQQEKTGNKIDKALHDYSERLRVAENVQARHEERLSQQTRDIDDLSKRSNILDVMVAVGATVASLLNLTR